ncbi:MAG: hypothetical protein JNM07_13420 [Phycisphaerae bacterium]|nr:hypothetical protein [Phycisphaerae bacterium]
MERRRSERAWMLAAGAGLAAGLAGGGCESAMPRISDLSGTYIAALCDADMPATAFADGRLGARDANAADSLTVVMLPIVEPVTPHAQVGVSNSAFGLPHCLAVSADGRLAFAVETRGPADARAATTNDLPAGSVLTAIDLSEPLRPEISAILKLSDEPTSVDVHPSGDFLAVSTKGARRQVAIVPLKGQGFGEPMLFPLMGTDDEGTAPGVVVWHPSGAYLAVTMPALGQVALYQFIREPDGSAISLARWGDPVRVGKYPGAARFTPDGKHLLVSCLNWGEDVPGFLVGAPEGDMVLVRLSDVPSTLPGEDGAPAPRAEHAVTASAKTGISPEGFAVSPDGRYIVTANVRRAFLPESDERFTRGGSLSLLYLNERESDLYLAGEFPLDALPQGVAFDPRGRFVVVSLFSSYDPSDVDGELGFWHLTKGRDARLDEVMETDAATGETYSVRVGVGKGPHGVLIVR